jgi:uncharacterized protein (TIRG00374 family)
LQRMPRWQNRLFLGFALGGIVFIAGSLYADFDKLIGAFKSFYWPYLLLGLALAFLNYVLRYIKFDYYLKLLGIYLPWKQGLSIFLSGMVLTITPGKLGELLKSFLIKQVAGEPVAKTAPVIIAERLTDFIAIAILSLGSILSVKYGLKVILLSVACLAAFYLIIGVPAIATGIIDFIRRFKRLRTFGDKLFEAYRSTRVLIGIKPLILGTLISIPAWFMECLAFYIIIKGFGSGVSLIYACFAYALSTIIGALSMLPGGLGITEIGLVGLLLNAGISEPVAVGATFIVRICTLWFAVLVGAAALILRHQRMSEIERILDSAKEELRTPTTDVSGGGKDG